MKWLLLIVLLLVGMLVRLDFTTQAMIPDKCTERAALMSNAFSYYHFSGPALIPVPLHGL